MIRGPKAELYSNELVDDFFIVKPFITFYLIRYYKNEFHDELALCVYSILQTELYFLGLVKKPQPNLNT